MDNLLSTGPLLKQIAIDLENNFDPPDDMPFYSKELKDEIYRLLLERHWKSITENKKPKLSFSDIELYKEWIYQDPNDSQVYNPVEYFEFPFSEKNTSKRRRNGSIRRNNTIMLGRRDSTQ